MACSGNARPLALLFIQMDVSNAIPSYSYWCTPIRPRQRRGSPISVRLTTLLRRYH